jgi:hypothetical protein
LRADWRTRSIRATPGRTGGIALEVLRMSDDLFDNHEGKDDEEDDFGRHGQAVHELVQDYLDEHEIPDSAGALLLLSDAITLRMIGYATEVEKPSASGLKLDLDRFRREMEEAVRAAKKGAEEFIETSKAELAAARRELEDEEGEGEEK